LKICIFKKISNIRVRSGGERSERFDINRSNLREEELERNKIWLSPKSNESDYDDRMMILHQRQGNRYFLASNYIGKINENLVY
jgi:hypothetical protein